ncbi:MAG: ABC transporter ATP-binding protein [Armatimonadota bacterium]|nr:MAG: ABC transporter ATP-binding protein [Armatimonadota bacterium]
MHEALPLTLQGVTKSFRQKRGRAQGDGDGKKWRTITALSSVSLQVRRGEIYGLLGPNGSGKSTLVRIVATLLLPDAGAASVFGRDVVREAAAVRKLVNRVSVEASFFKKLSAIENLLYAARLYGMDPREAAKTATAMLEVMGFPIDRIHDSVENLSRGQQQKVAITRGLFTSPVLLLLDEPTTGLDPQSKRDVHGFLRSVLRDHDATMLFTTHDMEEADRLCHRVGIMADGKIVAEGTPDELKARVRSDDRPAPTLEDVFIELTGKSLEARDNGNRG